MSESNRQTRTTSNTVTTTEIPPRICNDINASHLTLPLRHPRTLSPPEEEEIWTQKARELQHHSPPTSVEGPNNYCGAAAYSPAPSIPRQQPTPSIQQLNPVSLFLNPPSTIYELTPTLLSSLSHALTYSPEFHRTHRLRHHSIRTHTGISAFSIGVNVCANSEIDMDEDASRRIPDISLKVRLHPNMPVRYFTGIVWEIGFAQTLKSLRDRARMWFTQTHDTVQVHMVIVVHVSEHDLPEMYYDEEGNELMSRAKAVNTKLKWPSGWFKGRGILRKEKLLLEDDEGRGRLVPLLMEPLGGDLFVYRKKPEADLVGVDTNEKHFGDDRGIHPDDDSDADETRVQDSEFEAAAQEASDLEDTSSDQSSVLLSESESNDDREAGDLEDTSSDQSSVLLSESESNDDNEAEADLEAGLHRVYSVSLMRNSLIPPSLGSHAFEITLAELYGSVPYPNNNSLSNSNLSNVGTNAHDFPDELTNRMPPTMRTHAHKTIAFPVQALAEACLLQGGEMRKRRAVDRAQGIAARVKATAERGARRERRRKLHEVDDDEEVENEDGEMIQAVGDEERLSG
ncbi:hypothetical protein BGX38DRAFT_1272895 [Terfezia claveryi]|nr:hypothetical protein BGX38DRAFT_1272895 [Terfezia claveryi]